MDRSHDAIITQFVELTGCSTDVATDILFGCQWDIENAINMYFSNYKFSTQPVTSHNPGIPSLPKKSSADAPLSQQRFFSNNIPPPKKEVEQERLILTGNHEKFNEYRLIANDKRRWMLILLSKRPLIQSILGDSRLRDYTNTRYVPLEISLEESDGQWFKSTFKVFDYPCYAIIDPENMECVQRYEGEMKFQEITQFLKTFLQEHPEKGLPIDIDMVDMYNYTLQIFTSSSDSSDMDVDDDGASKLEQRSDPGTIISIMVQLPNQKRTKIEIGENEKVNSLYKKVASLANIDAGTFKLTIPFPLTELDDKSKTVGEMKLKNAMIVVNIQ
ncbi:hypothetical protein TRFO_27196 [Tritrichomonas foetus]|uniref:UBX domain-containing protein n=1 Tax=Tritrichomonas foetus TaxID=1144522 RepID=A0A1J4K652_9EUKA|nr:hypothetical protein TRFO_27196 [Tritrichomonas foetus]|eukprot:OHT05180.1 hypothetical protein TRFO_27196 [Tritrichomonas foetus]